MAGEGQWVRTSRLANVQPLRIYLEALQLSEELLQQYDVANRIVARAAEAQAFIENLEAIISPRFVAGLAYQATVGDLIGGLLNDSAYLISHTNLDRVIDRYGLASYIDNADELFQFNEGEPVKTNRRSFTEGFLLRMQGNTSRLGSTVLNSLRNEREFDSFKTWVDDIIFAFDDTGDFRRPIYGDGEKLGCVLLTVEALDPVTLFDQYNRLKSVFTRRPPPLPIDTSVAGERLRKLRDAIPSPTDLEERERERRRNKKNAKNMLNLGRTGLLSWMRPSLTPESWNTPPDFVKLSTRDLIPLLGDVLINLDNLGLNFTVPRPSLLSVENLAETLLAYVAQVLETISELRELVQTLLNILDATAGSRLIIPIQDGGVPGLISAIQAANPTRKDLQRITNPGSFGPPRVPVSEATLFRNDVLPYNEAVALREADGSVEFRPVENLLVAGIGIVYHPGALAELLESIFRPTPEDVDEDGGGTPVYDTPAGIADVEEAQAPVNPSASDPPDGVDTSSGNESDVPRTVSSPNPADSSSARQPGTSGYDSRLGDGRTFGSLDNALVGAGVRRDSSHASYSVDSRGLFVVGGGKQRTVVRKVPSASPWETAYERVIPLGLKSLPTVTKDSSVDEALKTLASVIPTTGDRSPVGSLPGDYAVRPEFSLSPTHFSPGSFYSLPSAPGGFDYRSHPIGVEIADGGTRVISLYGLDDFFLAYSPPPGVVTSLRNYPLPGARWYVDLKIQWLTDTDGGGEKLRTAHVRTELLEGDRTSSPITYKVAPVLPFWPVIKQEITYEGFLCTMLDTMHHTSVLNLATPEIDDVELDSPGVTFESILAFRKHDDSFSRSVGIRTLMILQSECYGVVVDSDSALSRGHASVPTALASTDVGVRTVSVPFSTEDKSGVYPYAELGSLSSEVQGATSSNVPLTLFPRESQQQRRDRAPGSTVLLARDKGVDPDNYFQENTPSDRWLDLPLDYETLLARVPKNYRVGLGIVGVNSGFHLPIPSSSWRYILVKEPISWSFHNISTSLDPADVVSSIVSPLPAFSALHAGKEWVLVATYNSVVPNFPVAARLTPFARHSEIPDGTDALYGGADRVLSVSDKPISARQGMCSPGLTGAFADLMSTDHEVLEMEARLLFETSRRPKSVQGRRVALHFLPLIPWSQLPFGEHTIWETQSHCFTLFMSRSTAPWLRLFERDLLNPSNLILRMQSRIPDMATGHRFKVEGIVIPKDRKVRIISSIADSVTDEVPSYSVLTDEEQIIPVDDPYPYVRAVDGFSAPSATIRIGRREKESLLVSGSRSTPWVETQDITISGSTGPTSWYLGAPMLGFIKLETLIEPAA